MDFLSRIRRYILFPILSACALINISCSGQEAHEVYSGGGPSTEVASQPVKQPENGISEVVGTTTPIADKEKQKRQELIDLARKQVGVKESPINSNRGPEVDQYNLSSGELGDPWCCAVKVWLHKKIGISVGGNSYVPSWFHKELVTKDPHPADYALVYFPSMSRYAHCISVIEEVRYRGSRPIEIVTLEGNTSNSNFGSQREGDGFYRRIRGIDSVTCLRFSL